MVTLLRAIQCLLGLAFATSILRVLYSAAFWIALWRGENSEHQELIDYLSALAAPVIQMLGSVEYLAFALMLEIVLRVHRSMTTGR